MANDQFKTMMNRLSQNSSVLRELSEAESIALKQCLLEMLQDVYRVCRKHDICLMLGGGSALGSVRHGGFIPWDDDLDLLMPRADFEKFKQIFSQELSESYILVSPNYQGAAKVRFPKIMKKGTTMKELTDINSSLPCHVFLDIFLLENVPQNPLHRRMKGIWCNFLMLGGSCSCWFEARCPEIKRYMCVSRSGKIAYYLRMAAGAVLSVIPSRKWFDLTDKAVQYPKKTGLLGIPTDRKHYFGEILPTTSYVPVSFGTFEGQEFPLPGDCDAHLSNQYGDYMSIPPVEERERHLIVDFSLER